jgi:hypothetical protein
MRRSLAAVPVLLLLAYACTDYEASDSAPTVPEAGVDASPSVEGGPSDASAEAASTGFCATRDDAGVLWCEDFDGLTDLASLVPDSPDPSLAPRLTRQTFTSEPQAVLFFLPQGTQAPRHTVIQRAFKVEQEARLETAWRWNIAPATPGLTLQSITIKRGSLQASFGYACSIDSPDAATSCGAFVASCTPTCTVHPIQGMRFGEWARVALQARFGPEGLIRFEEDGIVLLDVAAPTAPPDPDEPTSATIGLAAVQSSTSEYIETLFDDVVFELR